MPAGFQHVKAFIVLLCMILGTSMYARAQVFARIEHVNMVQTTTYNPSPTSTYSTNYYGDVYIRFYDDANCTIPATLPSNATINYEDWTENSSMSYPGGWGRIRYSVSANMGVTEVYLGNFMLFDEHDEYVDHGSYSGYDMRHECHSFYFYNNNAGAPIMEYGSYFEVNYY
jgi:hypothetical protein